MDDKKERKRHQNRIAQRTYRRNQKQRMQALEAALCWKPPGELLPGLPSTQALDMHSLHSLQSMQLHGLYGLPDLPGLAGSGFAPGLSQDFSMATTAVTTAAGLTPIQTPAAGGTDVTGESPGGPSQEVPRPAKTSSSHKPSLSWDVSDSASAPGSSLDERTSWLPLDDFPGDLMDASLESEAERHAGPNEAREEGEGGEPAAPTASTAPTAPTTPTAPSVPSAASAPSAPSALPPPPPPPSLQAAPPPRSTALHRAIRAGNLRMARLLLDGGASVHRADGDGCLPLYLAAALGDDAGGPAMVDLLLQHRADARAPNANAAARTPLFAAAEGGCEQTARRLLEAGHQDCDRAPASALVNARDGRGEVPLHVAVAGNWEAVVALLLAHGADVDA